MIAITIVDDELVETFETFRVNLLRMIGGARLGEMTSVTISIPPNDSPLGRFGFLELEVSPNSAQAATLKTLSPKVVSLLQEMQRRPASDDCSSQVGVRWWRRSARF